MDGERLDVRSGIPGEETIPKVKEDRHTSQEKDFEEDGWEEEVRGLKGPRRTDQRVRGCTGKGRVGRVRGGIILELVKCGIT